MQKQNNKFIPSYAQPNLDKTKAFVLWFDQVGIGDVPLVGGKNASLGEMYRNLTSRGVAIPNGFATTSYAYNYFLEKSGIREKIKEALGGLDTHNVNDLMARGEKVRKIIMGASFPEDLKREIIAAYGDLSEAYGTKNADVAVRSSATAEDLPSASFAGQQESYLNISGGEAVLQAVKECVASLFTNRAISYRQDFGFDHFKIALSVGVQKMVRSDLASSGVMFSVDTESGFDDVIVVNASYGLGENIVKGRVTPDEYYVFETTLKQGNFRPIVKRVLGSKKEKLVYDTVKGKTTKNVKVDKAAQNSFALSDDEVLQLSRWSLIIENHYRRSMDMEWAKDGATGKLFIVQARPETGHNKKDRNILEEYILEKSGNKKLKVLTKGASVGSKIGQGKANLVKDISKIGSFKKGEVLVTKMTDPDWEPIMKMSSAIVTDSGGRTCHAAIVSRELGIPCVVGTKDGTKVISSGEEVTVSCAEGEEGHIYEGIVPFKVNKTNIAGFVRPKTKVMMNLAEPDQAFGLSFIPNDGVGLAREEFIINNTIKIHPSALIEYENKINRPSKEKTILDKETIRQIEELTAGHADKIQYYIDKLAEGVGQLAAAFYPKDVIVRFSDFKTNEYANLIGGKYYEPKEENPMIGWRGASRYYNEAFKEAFKLECAAIKKVREVFGLTNVVVMVPFCRTPEEGQKVLDVMAEAGLRRGENGLRAYVMAEIPANIILTEEFCKIFDGFSIGSNDLTQLTLGIDRDNGGPISAISNEKNEAVKILIRDLIRRAHALGKKVGICGQAPSDFPDFAEFLVREGIDSISLTPDTVIKNTIRIVETEKQIGR